MILVFVLFCDSLTLAGVRGFGDDTRCPGVSCSFPPHSVAPVMSLQRTGTEAQREPAPLLSLRQSRDRVPRFQAGPGFWAFLVGNTSSLLQSAGD